MYLSLPNSISPGGRVVYFFVVAVAAPNLRSYRFVLPPAPPFVIIKLLLASASSFINRSLFHFPSLSFRPLYFHRGANWTAIRTAERHPGKLAIDRRIAASTNRIVLPHSRQREFDYIIKREVMHIHGERGSKRGEETRGRKNSTGVQSLNSRANFTSSALVRPGFLRCSRRAVKI